MVDLPAGKLLLFGGLDASEKRLDDTWIFDSITCVSSLICRKSDLGLEQAALIFITFDHLPKY